MSDRGGRGDRGVGVDTDLGSANTVRPDEGKQPAPAVVDPLESAPTMAALPADERPARTSAGPGPADVQIGALLGGRYEVLAVLGRGGEGVVLRARDRRADSIVALKLLEHQQGSEERLKRFRRELQMARKVTHPGVVRTYDLVELPGLVALSMELVEGEALDTRLARTGPLEKHALLDLALDLARALAAAHTAGVTHRDLKPANILLRASNGRAVVTDFGISRLHRDPAKPGASSPPPRSATEARMMRLTREGAIIGTPLYMAPEQLEGRTDIGPPTDVFAFGVVLFEAATGRPPHDAKSIGDLLGKRLKSPPPPLAEARPDLPGDFCRVVDRCLLPDVAARYADARALRAALDDAGIASHRRRRRVLTAAAVAAVAGALVFSYGRLAARPTSEPLCRAGSSHVHAVWNDGARSSVRESFARTGLAYADHAASTVLDALDRYSDAWARASDDACAATRLRGEQSEELMDLRMQCLAQRLTEMRAQVDVFAHADETTLKNAPSAVAHLTRLESCSDVASLRAPIAVPADPAIRARVDAVRAALATALARQRAGDYRTALSDASKVAEDASAIGYRPLEAEALYLLGDLQDDAGSYKASEGTFSRAVASAISGHHERVMARALNALVIEVGLREARHEDGHEWALLADAQTERLADDELRGELARNLGRLLYREHKMEASRASIEKCLALWIPLLGEDHVTIAGPLTDLGNVFFVEQRDDEAVARWQRSLAILEKALGPAHPYLAPNLNNLGEVRNRQGDYEAASAVLSRALALWEGGLGSEHPKVALALENLAETHLGQGDLDSALAYAERSATIYEKALGPEHPDLAGALDVLAYVWLAKGASAKALALFQREHDILRKDAPTDEAGLAAPLTGIGEAQVALGAQKKAIEPLEEALRVRVADADVHPFDRGTTRWALARALVAPGDGERARMLATDARSDFAKTGRRGAARVGDIDAWLARGH